LNFQIYAQVISIGVHYTQGVFAVGLVRELAVRQLADERSEKSNRKGGKQKDEAYFICFFYNFYIGSF
jgi:hypothetical protein